MSEKLTSADWYREFARDLEEEGFLDPNRYEVKGFIASGWKTTDKNNLLEVAEKHPDRIRRKPRWIALTGPGGTYYYPEPSQEPPPVGTKYWIPDKGVNDYADFYEWANSSGNYLHLHRGLCHLKRESAVKHSKAEILAAGYQL